MADENRTFFKRLRKLFQAQAIVTVDKDGNRKVFDTEDTQQTNLSGLRDRYTKIRQSYYEQPGAAQSMAYQQVRRGIFRDYDGMDQDPIISSALDIYADESTLKNEFGETLIVNSEDDKIRELLENLFYDILNIEFNLWPWVRNMCKYGDFFLGLEMAPKKGIVNVSPFSVYNTERLENSDSEHPNLVKFKIEDDPFGKSEYEQYEIAHFRLLSDTNWLPYGKAMIENARRLWKQLSLMEDAMLIHRIMRAPDKRVFKIDIGNIPQNEVENYMQRIINKMKKVPFLDRKTGDYNLKYNMQNLTEDFYLPVRGGDSGTSIDTLGGLQYSATEDIDYLKNKLFAALKIPKAYLGYESEIQGKATLAAEDVRFARTIERIQRTIISELKKIAIIHLFAVGIDENKLNDFKLELVNPSTIYEQEKVNLWSEKIRLAEDIKQTRMLSKDWIYKNIFKLSDHEQLVERGKVIEDLKDMYRYEQIEREGNDPAIPEQDGDSVDGMEQDFNDFNSTFESGERLGRPRETGNYKSDDHPYGRDPLGDDERTSVTTRTSEEQIKGYIKRMKNKYSNNNGNENLLLNEDNLLEDDDI